MEYTALYRRFRPKTFEEMVGQEHITRTLKNQITSNRIGHAYLFNGGRGTGKTSAAKIFARAINCINSKDGEPCNECEICKAMLNGSLTDVVEMDAASNNSVEDIRAIREEVNFLPTLAKYRVYIIDEVHMLSTGAFNALLKTLEEPPEHVKFILATTEPQKLPATILSRCQRFDFKKISNVNIEKRLEIICEEIGVKITTDALNLIAILSEGAMRDAISILERCIQDNKDQITQLQIKELAGIPQFEYINKLVKNILQNNAEEAMNVMEEVINEGKDLNNLLWEIIKYIRDIFIYKTSKKLEIYSEEEIEDIKKLAEIAEKESLLNLIYFLSNLENEIKWSSQKTILFQTGILRACMKTENTTLEDRVKKLEEKIETGYTKNNEPSQQPKKTEKKLENKIQKVEITKQSSSSDKNNIQYWPKILDKLKSSGKMMLYTNLINTTAKQISEDLIEVQFKNGITAFGKTILTNSDNIKILTELIYQEIGKEVRIKFVDMKNDETKTNNSNNLDELGIPINIID